MCQQAPLVCCSVCSGTHCMHTLTSSPNESVLNQLSVESESQDLCDRWLCDNDRKISVLLTPGFKYIALYCVLKVCCIFRCYYSVMHWSALLIFWIGSIEGTLQSLSWAFGLVSKQMMRATAMCYKLCVDWFITPITPEINYMCNSGNLWSRDTNGVVFCGKKKKHSNLGITIDSRLMVLPHVCVHFVPARFLEIIQLCSELWLCNVSLICTLIWSQSVFISVGSPLKQPESE